MTKLLTLFILTFSLSSFAKSAESATAIEYSKVATVHGMVCAFCSNSLEKKFKKEKAIDKVSVDLDKKTVSVKFKKGKSIKDRDLKEMITDSGFKVVKIKSYGLSDKK